MCNFYLHVRVFCCNFAAGIVKPLKIYIYHENTSDYAAARCKAPG